MKDMYANQFKKSYESRKYKSKGNVSTKTSPLGHKVDNLKTRKLPGQHKADPHSMIPHPRGCRCFMEAENGSKGHRG